MRQGSLSLWKRSFRSAISLAAERYPNLYRATKHRPAHAAERAAVALLEPREQAGGVEAVPAGELDDLLPFDMAAAARW